MSAPAAPLAPTPANRLRTFCARIRAVRTDLALLAPELAHAGLSDVRADELDESLAGLIDRALSAEAMYPDSATPVGVVGSFVRSATRRRGSW